MTNKRKSSQEQSSNDVNRQGIDHLAELKFENLFDYKALLDLFNEGICIKNDEGIILFANEQYCTQLGYTKLELIGVSNDSLYDDEKQLNISKSKMELRKKGIIDTYEIRMRRKDGNPIWLRVNGRPFFDEHKNFIGSIATHSRIEHKKTIQAELNVDRNEKNKRE